MSQTIGNYEILENLGDGQQGIVYKARSLANQQIIALKILKPQLAEVEAFAARFQREAEAMITFDHPYLVKAFEFGVVDGLHFCAMEFVEGETLYEKLRRREEGHPPRRELAKGNFIYGHNIPPDVIGPYSPSP